MVTLTGTLTLWPGSRMSILLIAGSITMWESPLGVMSMSKARTNPTFFIVYWVNATWPESRLRFTAGGSMIMAGAGTSVLNS